MEKVWKSQEDRITDGPGWTGSQKKADGRVPGRAVVCVWRRAMEAACQGGCLLRAEAATGSSVGAPSGRACSVA